MNGLLTSTTDRFLASKELLQTISNCLWLLRKYNIATNIVHNKHLDFKIKKNIGTEP